MIVSTAGRRPTDHACPTMVSPCAMTRVGAKILTRLHPEKCEGEIILEARMEASRPGSEDWGAVEEGVWIG